MTPVFPESYVVVYFFSFSDPSKLVGHVFKLFLVSESCRVNVIYLTEKYNIFLLRTEVTLLQHYFCLEVFLVEQTV